jgi:hypothetical protein
MKYNFFIFSFIIIAFLTTCVPVQADQVKIVRFRAPSIYGQNYASGFDRGYSAAWNAYRTGGELDRWVRNWKDWVITNPAYVRGYNDGVKQALLDAEHLEELDLIE